MRAIDYQQVHDGFVVVHIASGPLPVRVVESKDQALGHTKHRYFLTVDEKFRQCDALNMGQPGWYGQTKGEAIKEANILASKIAVAVQSLKGAEEHALNWDTSTNRFTVEMQRRNLAKLIGRYSSTIESVNT